MIRRVFTEASLRSGVLQVTISAFSKHNTLQSVLHVITHTPESSSSLHDAIYNLWLDAGVPLTAMPHIGYSLIASLQQHRSRDPLIRLLHNIWLGKAPMHTLVRMGELLRGLSRILETLGKIKLEDSPCAGLLPKADFVQMLQKLCPGKCESSMERLATSLSWHEEGDFVRVADIQCSGLDCTHIVDTSALCIEASLNTAPSEQCQEDEADSSDESVREEMPRHESAPVEPASQLCASNILEQEDELHQSQSVEDAADGDDPNPGLATSEHEPASVVTPDVQAAEKTGDPDSANHTLPVLLLRQHAAELETLRRATREAVFACGQDQWPHGDSLNEIQRTLESIPDIDRRAIPGCVHAWSRLPCPSTRDTVATGLLASAPIQRTQDFDLVAAAAWVDGLQGQDDGCGSVAMLPEVV